jgi:hypothetical protein
LDPLFSTWDRKRKTRHSWTVESGAVPLQPGASSTYSVRAPGPEAALTAGFRANLTCYQRGEEQWAMTSFVSGSPD